MSLKLTTFVSVTQEIVWCCFGKGILGYVVHIGTEYDLLTAPKYN